MTTRTTREATCLPKTVVKDANGRNVLIPLHQMYANTSRPTVYHIPIQPPPPSTGFSAAKTLLMDLDPNECGPIDDLEL